MNSKYFALFFVLCMLSTDFMIPVVLAGNHGNRGSNGLDLLLAAGILAKILKKKHHHHGHHHHHSRHSEAGVAARNVEVVHVAPPMGGYSYYPGAAQYYGGHQPASTSFSASIEYPFSAQSIAYGMHRMPHYAGPHSAAAFLGYEPQSYMQPMPMSDGAQGSSSMGMQS